MKKLLLAFFLCPELLAAQYTVQYDATTKKIVAPTNVAGMTFGGRVLTNLVGVGLTNVNGELQANLAAGTNIVLVTNANGVIEINTPPGAGSGDNVWVNHGDVTNPNLTNAAAAEITWNSDGGTNLWPSLAVGITRDAEVATWITVSTNLVPNLSLVSFAGQDEVLTNSLLMSAMTGTRLAVFNASSYLTNSTIADTDVLTTSSIDYVTAASMADADHGEVVWSGGVATIDKTEWDSMTITNLSVGDLNMTSGTMRLPNTSSDESLSNSGGVNLNTTDEQLTVHSAADGEISGEVSVSLIKTFAITFDPDAICDGAVDSLFLMWLGDEAPEGIIIDEWKISFEANPTTEIDADLCYADAMIGKANEVIVDAVDTTDGTATEDTDANINSGNAVPNGKVLYLDINTAYTESGHQVLFQMWYHYEAD